MSVTEDDRTAAVVAHSQMIEDIKVTGDDQDLVAYLENHIGWLHEIDLSTIDTVGELDAVDDPAFRAMISSRS